MEKFNVPTRDQVTPGNQAIFDNLKGMLGFVPNLYAAIAHSDNGLAKFLAFQNAKTSLSNKEKEAVNLVVSQVNGCQYCLAAHTAIGKMNGFSEDEIVGLRQGISSDVKLRALVAFAKAVTETRGRVPEKIVEQFYAAGYNHGNLVDVILQVSDKIAMNYLHNLTRIPVDFPAAAALEQTV